MEVEALLEWLTDACVSVWLDTSGRLRIDKDAPAELKESARAHKQELTDVCTARGIMHRCGMRCIRLPLGHLAVAYPPGANLDEIRWAMRVLRMDMPLVINDEGFEWITYEELCRRRKKTARRRPGHVRLLQREMCEIPILVAGAGSRAFLGRWLGQHVDREPWVSRSIAWVAGKGYLVIAKNDHEDSVTIELYADIRAVIDSDIPADLKRAATNQTIEDEAPDLAERMRNGDLTIGEAVRELFRRTSDDSP